MKVQCYTIVYRGPFDQFAHVWAEPALSESLALRCFARDIGPAEVIAVTASPWTATM